MKVEIRNTVSGTEYWDTEEKRTLFVAKGEEVKELSSKKEYLGEPVFTDLSKLTVTELREYATQNDIEIPADIKKKDDIVKFLSDAK